MRLKKAAAHPTFLVLVGLVIVLVGALVVAPGRTHQDIQRTRSDIQRQIVVNQRKACERGKLDRTSIANAFRAQSTYLNLVLAAVSVKQDVKDAALANQTVQDASASDLESRTGDALDCVALYPLPGDLALK